jgi:RHS repeat-associated protein
MDGVGATYDALDRMVEQNRSGSYTQIVYAPTGSKLALMNAQSFQKAFVPLPGMGTAVYTASGLAYYRHADWLGSSRFASTPGRTMYSDAAYSPFGEPYAQAGTSDLSFTGENQDTVPGLYDFPFREYATQGRWPSPDPAGLAAVNLYDPRTWNRYAYVLNDPLERWDDGMSSDDWGWLGGIGEFGFLGIWVPAPLPGPFFFQDLDRLFGNGCVPDGDPLFSTGFICQDDGGRGGQGSSGGMRIGGSSGFADRIKTVNHCAGELSQAGSVSNLSGGRVPELLGSNTWGDIASLATGSNKAFDQGAAVAAETTAHTLPRIAAQVVVGTAISIGKVISHTPGVYNPVTVGTTAITLGMTKVGRAFLSGVEGVLSGKVLLDAGVYLGALIVCSEQ